MFKARHPRTVAARIWGGLAAFLVVTVLAASSSASARGVGEVSNGAGDNVSVLAVPANFSPLGATANGPSGPATARFTATPHCCPSSAVVLTPTQVSGESDFQWMNLGLPWGNASISSVTVCYAISSSVAGRTYISQTRLSDMTLPNSATVMLDDGTNQTAVGPTCYTVPANLTPPVGALTLGLKVVFGSTSDRIMIGLVRLGGW